MRWAGWPPANFGGQEPTNQRYDRPGEAKHGERLCKQGIWFKGTLVPETIAPGGGSPALPREDAGALPAGPRWFVTARTAAIATLPN